MIDFTLKDKDLKNSIKMKSRAMGTMGFGIFRLKVPFDQGRKGNTKTKAEKIVRT